MSRSYMKYPSKPTDEYLSPPDWDSFRAKEKRCILDEIRNPESEYGDTIFPLYYGSHKRESWQSSKWLYYFKREIRNDYLKEIRNILNGYQEHQRRYTLNGVRERRFMREGEDHEEIFTEKINWIKNRGGITREKYLTREEYLLGWLNIREAKEAVKSWNGDPVDILYYLVNTGIIERAVRLEVKRRLRK